MKDREKKKSVWKLGDSVQNKLRLLWQRKRSVFRGLSSTKVSWSMLVLGLLLVRDSCSAQTAVVEQVLSHSCTGERFLSLLEIGIQQPDNPCQSLMTSCGRCSFGHEQWVISSQIQNPTCDRFNLSCIHSQHLSFDRYSKFLSLNQEQAVFAVSEWAKTQMILFLISLMSLLTLTWWQVNESALSLTSSYGNDPKPFVTMHQKYKVIKNSCPAMKLVID